MQTTPDSDAPKGVHHITLVFAIAGLIIESEGKILITFTIITFQLKFN